MAGKEQFKYVAKYLYYYEKELDVLQDAPLTLYQAQVKKSRP